MKSDYLKYWRVVCQYTKVRYNIGQADLDMLLFLYSEQYFTIRKFTEFAQLVAWDRGRFGRLVKEGWIENFRPGCKGQRALYSLSYKAKRMINSIYKKLEGEEIPETTCNNPMFKKNVRFTDKVYRHMIKNMNKAIREAKATGQQLHHVPE
jgi:hypothetical protein